MEPVEAFMEIFSRSWEDNNSDGLVRILKDANGYLRNVSKNNGERALEILLDKEKGLLKFIKTTIQNTYAANCNSPLKEAFCVLSLIIELFKDDYESYILETRDMCCYCMKAKCWFYARKSAAETLRKLIELFPNYNMQLHKIIEHYNSSYLKLYSKKDGCIFYIVIGAIAKYCPKTQNLDKSIDSIFLQILNDLKSQYKLTSIKQPEEIKLYLECLHDIFENFTPLEGNSQNSNCFEHLYTYISILCEPNNAQKVLRSKGVYFLSTYMKHFSVLVFQDYDKWHKLFNAILEETETHYNTIVGALKSFYKMIALKLLDDNREDIFEHFKNYFTLNFCKRNLPPKNSRLIIYGLGELSIAYAKYSPTEIYELFQMMALQTVSFYEREDEVDKLCETMADYLQALSKILTCTPKVSLQQVNIIVELSIFLTKHFPTYRDYNKPYVAKTLRMVFVNISQLEKNHQSEYFSSFFREGVLWSCASTTNTEFDENISDYPDQYKSYLSLWYSLFEVSDQDNTYRFAIIQIFNEFMQILISFIDKLNLNVRICENDIESEASFPLEPENEKDFEFFINLVCLYVDIFERIESFIFENWMEKLSIYFIKYSYKYPLISGFYKLIESVFKKVDTSSELEMYFSNATCELIPQYLSDILKLVGGFSDDLQLSCIHLIFNIPPSIVPSLIDEMIPVFKIAFTIGLSDTSLAFFALETLENWIRNSITPFSNDFFKNIILYLEPYISSEDNSAEIFQGITKKKRSNWKNTVLINDDENLENLQKKILLFYGSLDSDILIDLVYEKALQTDATWTKKNLLQCELFFPDIRLEINFDKFIPRILDIIRSSDLKNKISACEFLHAMITVMLGKRSSQKCLTKSLFDAVLKLGSDPNDSIRNLFHPLVIQLTHFFNSRLLKDSDIPSNFLDSIFEGLTNEYNPLLRDYCGLYLKEFTQWSIKQSTEIHGINSSNIKNVIHRITSWALYPSNKKRIGAAIAFNNLYTILRDNTYVVNTYWIELLYVFLKSLKECDDIEIMSALNHLEKVIKMKANLFNAKSADRRKPPDFPDATLKSLLAWLLRQCCSSDTKCRLKCMELFENLLSVVSDREPFGNRIVGEINDIALKSLEDGLEVNIENCGGFMKTLQFYSWILKKKLLNFNARSIFSEKRKIFTRYFVQFVSAVNSGNLSTPDGKSAIAIGEMTLEMLQFLPLILLEQDIGAESSIWNDTLHFLIARCTLCPREIGLTARQLQVMEKLPSQLETLLSLMMKHLPETQLQKSREIFSKEAKKNLTNFAKISDIVDLEIDIEVLEEFLKGLLLLKKLNFIDFELELHITYSFTKNNINKMFEACKITILDSDSCKKFDEQAKNYLQKLMNLLLEDPKIEVIQNVIELIINDDELIRPNGSTIPHGEYFLETFRDPIFQCMLKNSNETVTILEKLLISNPDKILFLIEELLIFAQRNKTANVETISDAIIARCSLFQRSLNDIPERKTRFFNINRIAVSLKKKPIEAIKTKEFYSWILDELISAKDVERKSMILKSFLICLTDEESDEMSPELTLIFRQLRDDDSIEYLRKLESNDTEKFKAASCFQILLKMMVATKSIVIYQAVIKFAAGIYKCLFKENVSEYLTLYFNSISDAKALKSLEIAYKAFMNLNSSNERLDVLRYFLIPSIELSKLSTIEKFYATNCQEIICFITQPIDVSNTVDRTKAIVTKIGCFSIFEVLFAKFDLTFINVKDPVSKSEKTVNQVLVQQSLEVRRLSAVNDQEKEIMRLLHCAALNCCISVISLKGEEKFYKFIFSEDRNKGQLIWEKIVDCEKRYNLSDTLSTIRRDRKKLINIRKRARTDEEEFVLRRFTQPVTLTLLEDIHAYDLNDTRILSEASKATNQESEKRLGLSLTSDELNDHECMPMLSGSLTDLLKNLGEISNTDLPVSLKFFRNAFATKKDNCRLFLMKLISNVKDSFQEKLIKHMFTAIVNVICGYLEKNDLNYIVRDTIVLLLESKCRLNEVSERKAAQHLLEKLIERASDLQEPIYKYNLELIETACKLWKDDGLTCPIEKLIDKITTNPELLVRAALILLRCEINGVTELAQSQVLYEMIKKSLSQPWLDDESKLLRRFELLGHILRLSPGNDTGWLNSLLISIEKKSRERCCRCVYSLYKGCRGENLGSLQISKFASDASRLADTHKPDCLELFILRIKDLDPEVGLPTELLRLGLKTIMKERILGCENAALTIIERLIPLFAESELSPYIALVAKNYTSAGCCGLEHRQKAYRIIAETYLKHGCKNPNTPLSKLCAKHLVQGLSSDPADEIREELLKYWLKFGLPSSCLERLLTLLEYYEPELGESFPRFFCLLMLQLTSESLDIDQSMRGPLGEDDPNFNESNSLSIRSSTLCRRRRILLLGPSLIARSSQSLGPSQNTIGTSSVVSWGPTLQPMSKRERMSKELNPITNYAPKYRPNYKFGDYPDVELSHRNFVESLKDLAINDWLSCRHLASAIISSLVERCQSRNQVFLSRLTTKFERLLTLEEKYSGSRVEESSHFIAVMLETMIQSRDLRLNVNAAAKLSRAARLSTLGVLILEQDLVDQKHQDKRQDDEEPAAKRQRTNTERNERESWIELSNLYKSIGERDTVKCIISRRGLFSEEFRKGAIAQAENDWLSAKTAYEQGLDNEEEYCFDATIECLAQLSSWGEINEKISKVVDGNYDAAWKHPRRDQLLPWILEGQLNKALEDLTANKEPQNRDFLDRFDEWLRAAGDEMNKIGTLLPQELIALMLLCDQRSKNDSTSRQYLKSSLDQLREKWIRLSPLSKNLRTDVLIRLRGIFNIHAYIETLRDSDIENATRSLIKYWDQRSPHVGQDLYNWNVHVLHRLTFAHLLHEKIDRIDDEHDVGLSTDLLMAGVRQRMAIGEMAIVEKNNAVAKKHMGIIERTLYELTGEEVTRVTNDFTLMASKYKFICGEKESRESKICKYYVNSWKIADELLNEDNLDISTKIKAVYHLFDLTVNSRDFAQSHYDFLECMIENNFVLMKLDLKDPNEFFNVIADYSFDILKNVCEYGNDSDMAESYTKFGKYCYNLLHEDDNCDETLSQELISSILTGMSLGSLGSAHYFPCLLKNRFYENNNEATEIFISKSETVPSWLFLSWQAQIISHLNGPLKQLLLPIIQRLARDYPSAIMYNFRSSYETQPEMRDNPEIRSIYEMLFNDSRIETFLDEMHHLCQPEYYVTHHLLKFVESGENIDSLFDKIFKSTGLLYNILDEYREDLEKLKTMDCETAKTHAMEISAKLDSAMKHRLKNFKNQALQMKVYSLYISNFSGEDFEIEVPGQYIEGKKPMPRYHTKISRFDQSVRIMESKCNPIKINIIGNDARTYSFLVKFGEDLRQDQRLQQVFRITNKTLENDNNCKKRYLSVNTYNVIPLSSSVGLIEWVDNTRSLQEFVEFTMTDAQRENLLHTVPAKYSNWIEKAGKSNQIGQLYKDALIKYSSEDVVTKMKELIDHFDWDFLRKTFIVLSTSAECFLSLRQNFITSYATMCIVHWITGIGDRHLKNILIQVKTGKCYGIDFESAFGIGIDQSVPELVPFRLTAQILGLFRPFDEQALFGTTMTHVLSALRKEKGPTLACLDTFIHEPLDWRKHMKKRDREDFHGDMKWLPQKKIAVVEKKLNGEKPSKIMLEELLNMHGQNDGEEENQYYSKYQLIVSGKGYHKSSLRSRMKNEFLTPEEQVQCLLEQAKDLDLLGRMYVGWCPFV